MNGVIGMNEMLLDTALDEEQRGYAEQVSRSSEHMLAIINDILDISTIETGRLELDRVDFDLRDAIEQACAPAAVEARAKGVELTLELGAGIPALVIGDGSRLRQVLMNLVSNAVKFTAAGSVRVSLREAPGREHGIRFEISDSGIGIDPDVLEHMFEPFTQADVSTTRVYGGNGLGLAIAKELVDLMGGAIGAQSEPGRGSIFWFELSLAPAEPTADSSGPVLAVANEPTVGDISPLPPPAVIDDDVPGSGLVLVVEDSPVNRIVAGGLLERAGFRTHLVDDAAQALEALASRGYDAVLMDCQMPGMDGYEATAELRRRESAGGTRTPVIAMTAHAMPGDRERCLDAGMDDYVTKPIRAQVLIEVLDRWIPRHRLDEADPIGEETRRAGEDALAVEQAGPVLAARTAAPANPGSGFVALDERGVRPLGLAPRASERIET
jgi:CheY-like chemotaxis protein/two-component sensor histidine kinase